MDFELKFLFVYSYHALIVDKCLGAKMLKDILSASRRRYFDFLTSFELFFTIDRIL